MKPLDQDAAAAQYVPSPSERVRDQVARYEATDGREGGTLEGGPVVILTMTGATSGKIRKTPVMRIEHDGTYLAVASAAGAPSHPAWYHNLIANPDVRLQDGAQVHCLRARELFGQEKAEAWKLAESRWPHFPEYRARAGREIPILLLEPMYPEPWQLPANDRISTTPDRSSQCLRPNRTNGLSLKHSTRYSTDATTRARKPTGRRTTSSTARTSHRVGTACSTWSRPCPTRCATKLS